MYQLVYFVASLIFMAAVWIFGYTKGAEDVKMQWQAERQLAEQNQASLEAAYERLAQDHVEQSLMVEQELKNERIQHEKVIIALRNDYNDRLRKQEQRIDNYSKVAASGTDGCRIVAGRAAELDRHLGEGIGLVEELTAIVGWRDNTIRMMGQQIKIERELLQRINP